MLKQIRSLYEYRDFLDSEKEDLSFFDLKRLSSLPYKKDVHKLRKLDIGLLVVYLDLCILKLVDQQLIPQPYLDLLFLCNI